MFVDKIEAVKNNKEVREEIAKRMTASTQDIITKHISEVHKDELRSTPVRKSLSCLENNISGVRLK